MLETFTIDTFKPRVGELFRVIVDEKWELRTQLTEVSTWGDETAAGRARVPFTLVFHGPREAHIPQAIYRVENENMDPFEVFLVPTAPDAQGSRYEAVFT